MRSIEKYVRLFILFGVGPLLIYLCIRDWFGIVPVRGRFESKFIWGLVGVVLLASGVREIFRKK